MDNPNDDHPNPYAKASYTTIRAKALELAALARSGNTNAMKFLCSLIRMATKQAASLLPLTPADSPRSFSEELTEALTDANLILHRAAQNSPEQFTHAREKLHWPTVRSGIRASGKGADEFVLVVQKLGLGVDLPKKWGLESCKAFSSPSVPVFETFQRVVFINHCRQWPGLVSWPPASPSNDTMPPDEKQEPHFADDFALELADLEPELFAFKDLPALSKDPAIVQLWWDEAIKPMFEKDQAMLLKLGTLKNYRRRAEIAKIRSCGDKAQRDTYRAKVETLAWDWFMKDCRRALEQIAAPVVTATHEEMP